MTSPRARFFSRLLYLPPAALLFAVLPPASEARTLHVSKSGDGSDGQSWATAFTAVGEAINSSASGDFIWVASGTYKEAVTLRECVNLLGGFIESETGNNVDTGHANGFMNSQDLMLFQQQWHDSK